MLRSIRMKSNPLQAVIQVPRGVQCPVISIYADRNDRSQIDWIGPPTAFAFRQDEPLTPGSFRRRLNFDITPPQALAIPAWPIRRRPGPAPGVPGGGDAQLGQQETTALRERVIVPNTEPAPFRSRRRDLDPEFNQPGVNQPSQFCPGYPGRAKLGQRHRHLPRVVARFALFVGLEQ
jgi:hypothetical protein